MCPVKFAAALTTATGDWAQAAKELARAISESQPVKRWDLGLLFVHSRFAPHIGDLAEAVGEATGVGCLVGSTGSGVIGLESEVERRPAISLLVGELPGVELVPFHFTEEDLMQSANPEYWRFQLELPLEARPSFVVLADPFSLPVLNLVDQLSRAYPAAPIIGGLASGGRERGENRLILDREVFEEGAIGVAMTGKVLLRTLVSQGCRPVGRPLVVTRAEKNVIFEMGGRPPLAVLQELLPHLSEHDQHLARSGLVVGRVINEYQDEFRRGDFLIRNLLGTDPQSGAVVVGDWLKTGQTVQFQLRDGETADEDLREMLAQLRRQAADTPARGALLFTCLGRGQAMYGKPSHDIKLVQRYLGPLPAAGVFCNGEIGPVCGRVFVHGFTSVLGLFCEPAT
jgi:small ligand-binding sensory domain FIST